MTYTEKITDADKGIVHFGGESKEVIEAEDRWHKAIKEIEEKETELGRAFASGMKAGVQEMLEKVVREIEKLKKDDSQIKGDLIKNTKEVLNGYLIRGGNQALDDLKPIISNLLK